MKTHKVAVLWDWNGTIVNDAWLFVEILNVFLNKEKKPLLSINDYRSSFCFPIESFYKKINLYKNKTTFEKTTRQFIDIYRKRIFEPLLVQNIKPVLLNLDRLGVFQFVVSAQNQLDLEKSVSFYGLLKNFSGVYGVQNIVALGKVALAKKIKKKLNIKHLIVVGDTALDYRVAASVGCPCVLVSWGHYHKKRLLSLSQNICCSVEQLNNQLLSILVSY